MAGRARRRAGQGGPLVSRPPEALTHRDFILAAMVAPAGDELDGRAGLIRARPLELAAWAVWTGRTTPAQAAAAAAEVKELAGALAARARAVLTR